jgi:hypothetical protein
VFLNLEHTYTPRVPECTVSAGLPPSKPSLREALVIELRIIAVLVLYVLAVLTLSLIQSLVYGALRSSIPLGSLAFTATLIAFVNAITALILAMSSHAIFNVVLPLHMYRCRMLVTFDCKLSPFMLRFKLVSALTLLPILILALFVGNMARLGLPVTPYTIAQAMALGIARVYGALELTGYMLAYITPLLERREAKLTVASLALTTIVLGAVVETVILLDVNSNVYHWWAGRTPYVYNTVLSLGIGLNTGFDVE